MTRLSKKISTQLNKYIMDDGNHLHKPMGRNCKFQTYVKQTDTKATTVKVVRNIANGFVGEELILSFNFVYNRTGDGVCYLKVHLLALM